MDQNFMREDRSRKNRSLLFRYPSEEDVEVMRDYINALSKERTYIRFQGEQVSLEDEKEYLKHQLEKIEKREAVVLLVFADQRLVGISSIEMQDKIEGHIGVLGISIAKDYRGEGIGFLLMKYILEEAAKKLKNLEMVTLYVFSNNAIAKKMYDKMGFIEYGLLPKGVKLANEYADQILMYKVMQR